ncbi:hypothetical protein AcV7_003674 [Taiwanofungus camphoratus]|nr:hypothetical protein AcV7_003674 [Antrodia cinnamomea]
MAPTGCRTPQARAHLARSPVYPPRRAAARLVRRRHSPRRARCGRGAGPTRPRSLECERGAARVNQTAFHGPRRPEGTPPGPAPGSCSHVLRSELPPCCRRGGQDRSSVGRPPQRLRRRSARARFSRRSRGAVEGFALVVLHIREERCSHSPAARYSSSRTRRTLVMAQCGGPSDRLSVAGAERRRP